LNTSGQRSTIPTWRRRRRPSLASSTIQTNYTTSKEVAQRQYGTDVDELHLANAKASAGLPSLHRLASSAKLAQTSCCLREELVPSQPTSSKEMRARGACRLLTTAKLRRQLRRSVLLSGNAHSPTNELDRSIADVNEARRSEKMSERARQDDCWKKKHAEHSPPHDA
jgi:hypothetical protein